MSGRLIPTTPSINKDRAHLSWSINSRHWTYGFRSRVKRDGERLQTDPRWKLHRKTQLFAHLMCTGEEFWRSPNVWKVSFWWMHSTILTWYTNHSLKWWERRKSFNSMTSTFQEPGTSTTGGEGVDDGHHPSERRNRWFDYPITTLSPTVDHADNRVNEEAMMAWFGGYSKNWYDVTSWWLRHVWDTKLIEIIKTVCKWRQRQHCLSQYSRRRSRRVYQYDLKNRVREHD